MEVPVLPALEVAVRSQLQAIHTTQTLQFQEVISDYMACLTSNRELQVRVGQLDKEAAELRDEVMSLQTRLASFDELSARDFATKAEAYRLDLAKAQAELTSLYRDKSKALEEVLSSQRALASAQAGAQESAETCTHQVEEISGLKARLSEISAELDRERGARQLAAAEAESRVAAKDTAEATAAKLTSENQALVQRLMSMKQQEAARLEQINQMHEEMMEHSKRQQVEAGAAQQLFGMLRRNFSKSQDGAPAAAGPAAQGSASSSRRSSTTGADPLAAAQGAVAAAAAGAGDPSQLAFASLKQKMGLPEVTPPVLPQRQLPTAPAKSYQPHKGGCCSLAVTSHGHYVASCGQDKTAQLWDLNLMDHVHTYQGILGAVNDVSFTSDGRRLLGAGADKRLLLWNVHSGQVAHTLTGHTNAVTCVSCSALDENVAVSAADDRSLKIWDLARGYSTRSVPCTRMPNALCLSQDGSTIITGHMDGSLCLWDMRQSRAGSQPLFEARDVAAPMLCVTTTSQDSVVLTAAKDNMLRLWDFRALSVVQTLKAPGFVMGSFGSMGRGKCHVDLSWDRRWAVAGAADGQVFVWDMQPRSGCSGAAAAAGGGGSTAAATVTSLQHHKEAVVAVGWSHDGTTLTSADKGGMLAMWQCAQ